MPVHVAGIPSFLGAQSSHITDDGPLPSIAAVSSNCAKLPLQQIPGGCRMSTTVEVLASAFKDAGTPFIVGHPGGESVELMEAARQRQMRFLLMKQEVAGAMLASTWG